MSTGAASGQFVFTKVADTDTPIPGGVGSFETFDSRPALDDGMVAFGASGSSGQTGLYLADLGSGGAPALSMIVDATTAIPNGSGSFLGFGSPALDTGVVCFRGLGASLQAGIYTADGTTEARIASTSTTIPSGTGSFLAFGTRPAFDGNGVVFVGIGPSLQFGVYTNLGGSLEVVADRNTAIPGGSGNFGGFIGVDLDSGLIVFSGYDSQIVNGIYSSTGGAPSLVADKNTPIPLHAGNFENFGSNPSTRDGDVALRGTATGHVGLYTTNGGPLTLVADESSAIPDGTGTFETLQNPSYSLGHVAFRGEGPADTGLYTDFPGSLVRIVAVGDTVDGRIVSGVSHKTGALEGDRVTFHASFEDGSQGVFVATWEETPPAVPSVPHWALAAAAGALAAVGARAFRKTSEEGASERVARTPPANR